MSRSAPPAMASSISSRVSAVSGTMRPERWKTPSARSRILAQIAQREERRLVPILHETGRGGAPAKDEAARTQKTCSGSRPLASPAAKQLGRCQREIASMLFAASLRRAPDPSAPTWRTSPGAQAPAARGSSSAASPPARMASPPRAQRPSGPPSTGASMSRDPVASTLGCQLDDRVGSCRGHLDEQPRARGSEGPVASQIRGPDRLPGSSELVITSSASRTASPASGRRYLHPPARPAPGPDSEAELQSVPAASRRRANAEPILPVPRMATWVIMCTPPCENAEPAMAPVPCQAGRRSSRSHRTALALEVYAWAPSQTVQKGVAGGVRITYRHRDDLLIVRKVWMGSGRHCRGPDSQEVAISSSTSAEAKRPSGPRGVDVGEGRLVEQGSGA